MMMHMLLTSPAARGLVHKAIIESGGGRNGIFPARKVHEDTPNGPTSAESVGVAFAKSVGIEGTDAAALAALRKVPAEQVIAGLNLASMGAPAAATYAGGPMIDPQIMVETAEDAYRAGHNAKVPLIVGANSLDIGFSFAKSMDEVMAKFGANKDKALAAYDPDKSGDLRSVGYKVAMDAMMVEPARFLAKTYAAQGQPAYLYRFSYVAESLRAQTPGAPHATEIPFVFGESEIRRQAHVERRGRREGRQCLLGELREDRQPEWRGAHDVARLQTGDGYHPRLHEPGAEGRPGRVEGADGCDRSRRSVSRL